MLESNYQSKNQKDRGTRSANRSNRGRFPNGHKEMSWAQFLYMSVGRYRVMMFRILDLGGGGFVKGFFKFFSELFKSSFLSFAAT
jgi:hypothetical protein